MLLSLKSIFLVILDIYSVYQQKSIAKQESEVERDVTARSPAIHLYRTFCKSGAVSATQLTLRKYSRPASIWKAMLSVNYSCQHSLVLCCAVECRSVNLLIWSNVALRVVLPPLYTSFPPAASLSCPSIPLFNCSPFSRLLSPVYPSKCLTKSFPLTHRNTNI